MSASVSVSASVSASVSVSMYSHLPHPSMTKPCKFTEDMEESGEPSILLC